MVNEPSPEENTAGQHDGKVHRTIYLVYSTWSLIYVYKVGRRGQLATALSRRQARQVE